MKVLFPDVVVHAHNATLQVAAQITAFDPAAAGWQWGLESDALGVKHPRDDECRLSENEDD